jgi:hypothetical protein
VSPPPDGRFHGPTLLPRRQFGYAGVRVRFYDADEAVLDSMRDDVNDLDPGQVWRFSVPSLGWGEDARAVAGDDIAVGTTF